MATLVLGAAASAFAGSIGAGPLLTTLLTGAAAVGGAFADNLITGALTPTRRASVQGAKISDLRLQTSTEGSPVQEAYGRVRLAGQVIWATRLRMDVTSSTESSGGKGLGGGGKSSVTTTTYNYYANFAVGLCEGEINGIGRVWADGKILDISKRTHRLYKGTDDQQPDPFIQAKEGTAPAYRGTAYIVFENLALADFGNRIPQLEFEVFRQLEGVEDLVQGMVVIPGAGEWVYATQEIRKSSPDAEGASKSENINNQVGSTDWSVSIDNLEQAFSNTGSVFLVCSWFGLDLRCGTCDIRPGVEFASNKTNTPLSWQVHGTSRAAAHLMTRDAFDADRPAIGGTPSDQSIVQAIRDLAGRGLKTVFCPFLLMDIAEGNGLADPYGEAEQKAYPWRGRITCHPASGEPGTVDKSAAAATQVDAFFGTVTPTHISVSVNASSNAVTTGYTGPSEWRYRRMILHYAKLCAAINAVEPGAIAGFVIGSEMRGLTTVRSGASTYPAVAELVTLAGECKAILGGSVDITYAADWSEYHGHAPSDGSGDLHFHLDPLWSSASVDAVAIDNYMKLSDWRDGPAHLDLLAGWPSITDLDYLKSNVEGGEDYDWYYASEADRDSQARTAITDGSGKPWVYRAKDFKNWWLNQHHDRPGGVESGSPTAWVPQSKPIWFTEYGFPSVDKATNQPNVFVDPKSSESNWPYYSNRQRRDFMQRRGIEALLEYWAPDAGNNPVSGVYGGRMLDLSRSYLWTWDARPYPAWPNRSDIWGDTYNWQFGHWVQGKLGVIGLAELVAHICSRIGFTDVDVSLLSASVVGWLRSGISSPREQLDLLAQIYRFDMVETGSLIKCIPHGLPPTSTLTESDLASADRDTPDWNLTRAQETDLPVRASFAYWDAVSDYRQTTSSAGRLVTTSARHESLAAPLVIDPAEADGIVEAWLLGRWVAREQAEFALPPSRLGLEPGDVLTITIGGRTRQMRIARIVDGNGRQCEAVAAEPSVNDLNQGTTGSVSHPAVNSYGEVVLEVLDLPTLNDTQSDHKPWLAAYASPWAGAKVLEGSRIVGAVLAPATLGRTTTDLSSGTPYRFDRANTLTVKLSNGTVSSVSDDELLEGTVNALAIQNSDGDWEILQFATAELIADKTWRLSVLLRGRLGTEHAMRAPVASGARVVLIDTALTQADVPLSDRGIERSWSYGPAPLPSTDATFKDRLNTLQAVALKPFSSVHLRGKRDAAGNLQLTWIRRTRRDGTWADGTDVPLNEDAELYDLEVLNGSVVVRTAADLTSPAYTYSVADQITDFGSAQTSISIRVTQVSGTIGRGTPEEKTL